jgi:acetyltransferase-like isoleucine patch superfamily enzyme
MTESEKMQAGLWYDANYDQELMHQRLAAEELCFEFNSTRPSDTQRKNATLKKLIPDLGERCVILSPFTTDYGCYCHIGDDTFINHNAYLMDCADITIGSYCFIGPNCGLYTAIHPILPEDRNQGLEKARPIIIGNNCWLGGDVTVLPGVTIGENSVIGAGSVVTRDIPANVVAAGNPCRVLRSIGPGDSVMASAR